MTDLLPCPFCGSNILLKDQRQNHTIIFCEKCGCKNDKNIWNTRASGWISVKDRLPEVPERCSMDLIIYTRSYVVQGAYSGDGKWFQFCGFSYSSPRIHMRLGDEIGSQSVYSIPNELVTHWMPLPLPPTTPKDTE